MVVFYVYRVESVLLSEKLKAKPTIIEMLVSGIIGLTASLVLSVEAWKLAGDSEARFSCDINSVISCSTVAQSDAATVFGFPNAFLGLVFESFVLAITLALLFGSQLDARVLRIANAVYFVALVFAYWLFYQSYAVLGVLCPWCLTITVTTTLVFFGLTRLNVLRGVIPSHQWLWEFVYDGFDWFVSVGIVLLVGVLVTVKYVL